MECIVLKPKESKELLPGILWIHGGGYVLGMASMVHMSCGKLLAKKYGAVVISPEYRLADKAPYPAALEDCYGALEYMWDNHGRVWNTKRNHWGWKKYLGELYCSENIPVYASPAKEKNYANLPKCYTFVSDGEPFYQETLDYVQHLQEAGVKAEVDVYKGNIHAFDMLCPWKKTSRQAKKKLCHIYESWF